MKISGSVAEPANGSEQEGATICGQSRTLCSIPEDHSTMSLQKVEQGKKVQGKSTLLQLSAITSSPKVVRAQRDCTRKEKVSVVTGTVDNVMRDKELQIQQLTNKCRTLQTAYDNLVSEHEVLQFELDEQKAQLDTLKEEAVRREKEMQDMLLQSYAKGKQAAIYERHQLLEELTGYTDAKRLPANLTVPELLFKLQTTQTELERCQATMREKTYADAEKLDSEPEIVLHFLRDSIFHFLTDHKTAEQHLNAIIGMLGFPEEQIKKIESSRDKDHRRL